MQTLVLIGLSVFKKNRINEEDMKKGNVRGRRELGGGILKKSEIVAFWFYGPVSGSWS